MYTMDTIFNKQFYNFNNFDNFVIFTESLYVFSQVRRRPSTFSKEDAVTQNAAIDSLDLVDIAARGDIGFDVRRRKAFERRKRVLAALAANEKTEALLERRKQILRAKRRRKLETRGRLDAFTESSEIGDMKLGAADNTETLENVIEHAGETPQTQTMGTSPTDTSEGSKEMHTLENFFKRPTSIYDATWNSGTEYDVALKVWDLWSIDQTIRAKLSNYSYFKGNLKVKVSISGTPYHYGRMMLSYQPYAGVNTLLTAYDNIKSSTTPGPSATVLECYKGYLSQAPGVTYLDVKENEPVILDIPFISHKQMFRLYNESAALIDNLTSYVDFAEAGELRMVTLNPFKIANDDYDTHVSINVYAWVEDVELGCITGTNVDITAESREIFTEARNGAKKHRAVRQVRRDINQLEETIDEDDSPDEESVRVSNWKSSMEDKPMYSGEGNFASRLYKSIERGVEGDEYKTPGPVSNIASAVSGVGESLKDIPVIGGFAKATSTISKGIGKVASWFGWSKPLVLEKAMYVKNQPFSNGAVTAGNDTAFRITVDPKQELTVDHTLGGVDGPDDMAICTIAARESYFSTFTWSDVDIAMDTVLWRGGITPQYISHCDLANGVSVLAQPTACGFAVTPFQYWRGRVKLRFEIICSKFHRGKILFKYEPNMSQAALISTNTTKLNQQNTAIVDIQDTQNIEFEFDWAYPRAWASTSYGLDDNVPFGDTTREAFNYTSVLPNYVNGFMEVRPLNELIQPTSTASLTINVYISCEDLQVAHPTGVNMPNTTNGFSRYYNFTESKEITSDTINPTGSTTEGIHSYHFGEKILSFRSLLKRYQTTRSIRASADTVIDGLNMWEMWGNSKPLLSTPAERGTFASRNLNLRLNTLYNYLRPAFMGERGGYRFRLFPLSDGGLDDNSYARVSLAPQASIGVDWTATTDLVAISATSNAGVRSFDARYDGTVNYHVTSNGGIEFEIPYYSDNLFRFAFASDNGDSASFDPSTGYSPYDSAAWIFQFLVNHGKLSTGHANLGRAGVVIDSASAEDFTFLRFQGAPFYTN